jgi:thiosulfate/3-mercaptopyruvate sulfurtransferase
MSDDLVTPEWLEAHLDDPSVFVLDCTWFVPQMNRSGRVLFRAAHIPKARYIDLDDISDLSSPYINMMPTAEFFAQAVGRLGIGNDTTVVVYNSNYVSARLWWMFRHFGHSDVKILDGGLQRWINENRALETGDPGPVEPRIFTVSPPAADIATADDVLLAIRNGDATVIDVRPKGKFDGTEPTGYPGVAPGHMPSAINLPWSRLFNHGDEKRFISTEEFTAETAGLGIDLSRPVIATCGSGITASVLAFHLTRAGNTNWRIYDGSWHEWGQRDDLPKLTSA